MKPSATASTSFSSTDLLAALAVVVIWGLNFVAMKLALRDFTPFQLGGWRYVFAVLPLALVVKFPSVNWRWVLAYGLCQGVGQFGFLFVALHVGMTASLASVLMQTQVFFTALMGYALLGERLNTVLRIGLSLAAFGLVCFAMNYVQPAGSTASATTAAGFFLNLIAAAFWAGSNIVARRTQQSATQGFNALSFVVWSSLVPILPFLGLTLLLDDPVLRWRWLQASWVSWLAVAYLGWFATVAAYAMWTGLLKRYAANRVAPFSLGVPVVGLIAGMSVLGESVTAWQWAGIVLVVLALVSVMVGPKLAHRFGAQARP